MTFLVRQFIRSKKPILFSRDPISYVPISCVSVRNITFVPAVFDKEDPGPKFFSQDVQNLLKRLTRPDFSKVFRKRTSRSTTLHKWQKLRTPTYKFLTTEQLEKEIVKAKEKADILLQMPPVVKIQQPVNKVLSCDPALSGLTRSKYVFTDISFGVSNDTRLIVERDTGGTLRYVDHETRKRLNQVYFPMEGRKMRDPPMFTDEEKLYSLLDREEYEFVLDRASVQYDPDELTYQKIVSIVYQHIDNKKAYHHLRSTRHFGPLVFYLAWNRNLDGLILELLQTGQLREAVCAVALRHILHGDITQGDEAVKVAQQVLPGPMLQPTYETMTEEDILLDDQCVECVARYVANNSSTKGLQELALQALRESRAEQVALSRGLRKAHGQA